MATSYKHYLKAAGRKPIPPAPRLRSSLAAKPGDVTIVRDPSTGEVRLHTYGEGSAS